MRRKNRSRRQNKDVLNVSCISFTPNQRNPIPPNASPMPLSQASLSGFSSHLFWDVKVENLDINRSRKLIIHRVLDYGLIGDWQLLVEIYGIPEIAATAASLRNLDKRSASFVSMLSKVPKEQFLCFTSKQSTHGHSISWIKTAKRKTPRPQDSEAQDIPTVF